MLSQESWRDGRMPDRVASMGLSIDDEGSADVLLPPYTISNFQPHAEDTSTFPRQPQAYSLQLWLQQMFVVLGRSVTSSPGWTILTCVICTAGCMLGLIHLHIETDPLVLWVPPTSRAAQDKAAFDSAFGPFYRIEQIIISSKPGADGTRPPILSNEAIRLVCPFGIGCPCLPAL